VEPVRFARSARNTGSARPALHVIDNSPPIDLPAVGDFDGEAGVAWPDDRRLELEIVAIILPSELLIIHVMPTTLRRKSPSG